MNNRRTRIALTIVVSAVFMCLAVIVAGRLRSTLVWKDSGNHNLLREVLTIVETSYVEKPDRARLVKSMIDGMLAALDPHSAYLPPEPYKEMAAQMSGSFGGVGIELGMKDGKLTVISPIEDTPAFRAGIQAGDHITAIDATPTRGLNIMEAVKRMRGEKGTRVTLSILRGDTARLRVIPLVRDIILIKSLKVRTLEPGYGFIRISQFQERTADEFRQALDKLHEDNPEGLQGLILDMRYNPGGLVAPSVQVANCFIGDDPSRTLIVSVKGRMPGANQVYHASPGQKEARYPLIVLVNGGSASASEIVAGALQDHKRAIIMGTQTFGKGSVQNIFPLPNKAALKLTTGRYYTPSGRSIQAKGITPDIVAANQLPVVMGTYSGAGQRGDRHGEPVRFSMREVDTVADIQLRRALDLLKELQLVKGVLK